MKTLSFQ